MQQMPPPSGSLFPDTPQQQSAPRFQSNAGAAPAQTYEPQSRRPASPVPVMPPLTYATGQLRALHGTPPVTQAPPMATMPTAQAYQQQSLHQAPVQPAQQAAATMQGTPLIVHTVQGVPVAVNAEEMERALSEHASRASQKRTGRKKQKKEIKGKQKQSGSFVMKFSVVWVIFGVIGIISVVLLLLEYVGIPLLVLLNDLTQGGAA